MVTLNQISIRVNDIKGFRGLLEVYEDLAAQKIGKIRDEISQYREYAQTLTVMSSDLEIDISTVIKKNTKHSASVLISSDKGLYGNAFDALGQRFWEHLKSKDTDAFVIGSIGVELMEQSGINIKYTFIKSDEESLVELWKSLSEYQEINIYYLKYNTLAKQSVDTLHISGELIPKTEESYEYNEDNKLKYLYEPTVLEVAEVFAKEVLVFLAEQTMKEANLAKYAARLMYLDSCLEKNNNSLVGALKQKMILSKRLSNKRQNARMASYLVRSVIS